MQVSISSGWFGFGFFLFFLGDAEGTAGVFGVAVEVLSDAVGVGVAGAGVAGVGVTGAGVAGGTGVAATATAAVGGAFI